MKKNETYTAVIGAELEKRKAERANLINGIKNRIAECEQIVAMSESRLNAAAAAMDTAKYSDILKETSGADAEMQMLKRRLSMFNKSAADLFTAEERAEAIKNIRGELHANYDSVSAVIAECAEKLSAAYISSCALDNEHKRLLKALGDDTVHPASELQFISQILSYSVVCKATGKKATELLGR